MNDPETADELPTEIHLWARQYTGATINEVTHLNLAELCESVVFLHNQSSLTLLINDPQTADKLPTKIISFVGEAGHRRNINEITLLNRAEFCESVAFLTQSK